MADELEQRIRERAYALWEADGKPHGKDRLHWDQAARELAGDTAGQDRADDPAETEAEDAIEVIEAARVETAARKGKSRRK